ncbi:MFS transporter [Mitsuaria sp. GD03876]|uniref:MFS transporter n=1 Tax=Mitsuaria sp. GD03876 TaxID=2975399 RepID=UPI002448FAA6|nr:MFS transporter [Mitsuaria sp. GD03876]MDH0863370.1 MFS transporter [Mitsuaria sp. GD03876]
MTNDNQISDALARQRRRILTSVCLALMAVIASVSGLNVAQPQMALALDASQSDVLWLINSYAVVLAALLLPLGALGDRWGRKPALLGGLVLFGLANLGAALSTSTEFMLASRVLSGVGAALIMPITLAVITAVFPAEERSKAIGIWTGVAGGGGVIGMFLSAALVDFVTWRWLFALPVALVLVSLVMTWRDVPNSTGPGAQRYDLIGALLSAVSIVGLCFALDEGPKQGWGTPWALSGLAVFLAGAVAFVLWERRHPAPLLDLAVLRDRGLSAGSATLTVLFGVQAGVFIVLFPFFQGVLGWSGLRATSALMPMAFMMMLFSGIAPRAARRFGAWPTMSCGVALGGAGLAAMAHFVTIDGGYASILPGMLLWGLGTGLAMAPATEAITSALPMEKQGVASALNDVTRELGTALGVALLGAVFAAGYGRAVDARLSDVQGSGLALARKGLSHLASAGPQTADARLLSAARGAFVEGWQVSMWVGVAVMALLVGYLGLRRRGEHRGA